MLGAVDSSMEIAKNMDAAGDNSKAQVSFNLDYSGTLQNDLSFNVIAQNNNKPASRQNTTKQNLGDVEAQHNLTTVEKQAAHDYLGEESRAKAAD